MTDRNEPTPEEMQQRKEEEDRERENREVIALGVEAGNFLNSPLAQFINNSAEAKVVEAMSALTTVDPTDKTAIVELQATVAKFSHYKQCLEGLVAAGQSAYQIYLQGHHGD